MLRRHSHSFLCPEGFETITLSQLAVGINSLMGGELTLFGGAGACSVLDLSSCGHADKPLRLHVFFSLEAGTCCQLNLLS